MVRGRSRRAPEELTLLALSRAPVPHVEVTVDLRLIDVGAIAALAVPRRRGQEPIEAALREQHEIVLSLADRIDPLLPVRFGTHATGAALPALFRPWEARLLEALERVRGCRQMTVRILGPRALTVRQPAASSGRAYLALRAAAASATPVEIEPLVTALRPYVVEQRVRIGRGDVRATLFHLVRTRDISRYRRQLDASLPSIAPWLPVATGPWPAFAFAPDPV